MSFGCSKRSRLKNRSDKIANSTYWQLPKTGCRSPLGLWPPEGGAFLGDAGRCHRFPDGTLRVGDLVPFDLEKIYRCDISNVGVGIVHSV